LVVLSFAFVDKVALWAIWRRRETSIALQTLQPPTAETDDDDDVAIGDL